MGMKTYAGKTVFGGIAIGKIRIEGKGKTIVKRCRIEEIICFAVVSTAVYGHISVDLELDYRTGCIARNGYRRVVFTFNGRYFYPLFVCSVVSV